MDANERKSTSQFIKDNFGKDKLFPGAPSCEYKGKKVPAFVTFSEGGGINGWILTEILKRIDDLGIYNDDRRRGMSPFLLLDGHNSRFDLQFLRYVNDEKHKWCVCLVPRRGSAQKSVFGRVNVRVCSTRTDCVSGFALGFMRSILV